MTQKQDIPRKTVYRLSLYQRCLQHAKRSGVETIASDALAKGAGVKPAQLRKDLAHFGQFGTRGLGYNVDGLSAKIAETLGTARLQPVILVGVGHLGSALLRYGGFNREGFEIVASFDIRVPEKPPGPGEVPVLPAETMTPYIQEHGVKLAILTCPGHMAQSVANELVAAGVQAILNFAPTILVVPEGVQVNYVDLAMELENLSYFIR